MCVALIITVANKVNVYSKWGRIQTFGGKNDLVLKNNALLKGTQKTIFLYDIFGFISPGCSVPKTVTNVDVNCESCGFYYFHTGFGLLFDADTKAPTMDKLPYSGNSI